MNYIFKTNNISYSKYEELLLRRDNLLKDGEHYYREYLRTFGNLIKQSYEAKIECIKKKKMIAYCQKRINNGNKINKNELNNYIAVIMEEYYNDLDAIIRNIEASKKSTYISPYQVKQIKDIYYRLVKLIHPDIRPDLQNDANISDLWNRIVVAYQCNHLSELQKLEVLVKMHLENLGIHNADFKIENIDERIKEIEDEINTIISSNPYQYRFILEDSDELKRRTKEFNDEIKNNLEYAKQLDEILEKFNYEVILS